MMTDSLTHWYLTTEKEVLEIKFPNWIHRGDYLMGADPYSGKLVDHIKKVNKRMERAIILSPEQMQGNQLTV